MAPGKGRSLQCRAGKGRRTEFESKEAAVASLVARWKASAYSVGDPGSIPGLGRSPGEGNGNPLQYSCLENPMDGGTW